MNPTFKRFHYCDYDQLRTDLQSFIAGYNFGRRLKTLKGTCLRIHLQAMGNRT